MIKISAYIFIFSCTFHNSTFSINSWSLNFQFIDNSQIFNTFHININNTFSFKYNSLFISLRSIWFILMVSVYFSLQISYFLLLNIIFYFWKAIECLMNFNIYSRVTSSKAMSFIIIINFCCCCWFFGIGSNVSMLILGIYHIHEIGFGHCANAKKSTKCNMLGCV